MRVFSYILYLVIAFFFVVCGKDKVPSDRKTVIDHKTKAEEIPAVTEAPEIVKQQIIVVDAPKAVATQCAGDLATIKSNPDCHHLIDQISWLFEAKTKDAKVSIDPEGIITWLSGEWLDGTWVDGIWEDGTWVDGVWQFGTWVNGVWQNGMWEFGIWKNGTWESGTFLHGVWEDGIWESGVWAGNVWKNGIWKNGVWWNGIWENGTWENGDWFYGIWKGDPAKQPVPKYKEPAHL